MEDYPRDLAEFEARLATEEACRDYLYQMRWPDGFRCPNCGHGQAWPVRKVFECARCARQTSVTAGTIFQDSRQPLRLWFRAMWRVTTQKNGASALGLQRVLGLRSYKTAWSWLHKFRRAMVRPGRDSLTGRVEVIRLCWAAWKRACGDREKTIFDATIYSGYLSRVNARPKHPNTELGTRLAERQHAGRQHDALSIECRFARDTGVPGGMLHRI